MAAGRRALASVSRSGSCRAIAAMSETTATEVGPPPAPDPPLDDGEALRRWLQHLGNDNAQGEYYLTDVFASAAAEFNAAEMVHVVDPIEVEGANDAWQLAQLERAFQRRAARALCLQGARLADPSAHIAPRVTKAAVTEAHVQRLEETIDRFETELAPLRRFILPGGSPAGAALHLARTVCRRAERCVVALGPQQVEPIVVTYLNRLSDLLFVMARLVNQRAGVGETEW